jgi:hypothetical protein
MDYEVKMQGTTPKSRLVSLENHGLTGFNQELSDPVDVRVEKIVRGKKVYTQKRLRPAQELALTFTIVFGSDGPMWTPALQRAREAGGGECQTTFYAKRLCAPSDQFSHVYIWPDTTMNPPTRVNDFIPIGDNNPVPADWQSEVRAEEEILMWGIASFMQADGTTPLYAVAFRTEECEGCGEGAPFSNMIVTGGTGSAALYVAVSNDRFATKTDVATPAATNHIGKSIFTDGDVALVGYALKANAGDVLDLTGGVLFSANINSAAPSFANGNITTPIHAVTRLGDLYIAAGGIGGGQATMWTSEDGLTWTAVTSAALPALETITGLASDEENAVFYAVGTGGTVLRGQVTAGSVVLTALTGHGASTSDVLAVAVLAPGQIAIAGASGYYAETFNGGTTWARPPVSTTSDIQSIAGGKYRTILGVSNATILLSDPLTDFVFKPVTVQSGTLTNAVRGVAYGDENYFAAVTAAAGEIHFGKPFFPNA